MRRITSEVKVGDTKVRYRVKLEGDPCEFNSGVTKIRLFNLLSTVVQCPDLLNCGWTIPDKINISHNGQSWVIEAEATVTVDEG